MPNKYKKNFLTKVVFRIDFNQIKLGQLKYFSEKIEKRFPINEEEKGEEGVIDFDFKTKKVKQISSPVSTWVFYNKTRIKKIKVHPRFLLLEYNKYKDSTELLKDIKYIENFIHDFKIKTINKMGLRYVNEIELSGHDFLSWKKYINNKLIGSLSFATNNKKKLARFMSLIILKEEFGDINFNYGLWNSNYPNEINERKFILDFDGRSRFPLDVDNLKLGDLVKEYNEQIENLFEDVIKEDLRKILRK